MELAKSLDEYYSQNEQWDKELKLLRDVILSTGLTEDLKWGAPAFLYKGKNLLGIAAFKNYVGLWFHQGVFLRDEANVLVNAQKGKTKALRQLRFSSMAEIDTHLVKAYVLETIDNHLAGKEIKPERNKEFVVPDELTNAFKMNPVLDAAYKELSWGKQKEYCNYISDAKQAKTKLTRLKKVIPLILQKQGLNDKYR